MLSEDLMQHRITSHHFHIPVVLHFISIAKQCTASVSPPEIHTAIAERNDRTPVDKYTSIQNCTKRQGLNPITGFC